MPLASSLLFAACNFGVKSVGILPPQNLAPHKPHGLAGYFRKERCQDTIDSRQICLHRGAVGVRHAVALRVATNHIKVALAAGDMQKAQQLCDKQRGSVANVVGATLVKYAEMERNTELTKDQKQLAIQQELEEATALELPMMQENLPIIGTITTLGTLMGLLGTVIGMIRSFAALAAGGSADSMALSQGISEALINTAFGILTGALAVISYNYYTNKIDKLTFALDEVGFSIVQTFAATHK